MAYSFKDSTAQAFSGVPKTSFLRDSTVEAFAEEAGLKENSPPHSVTETECSFEVEYTDNVYLAEFKRKDHEGNEHAVACFSLKNSGRSLTREEAKDLMQVIRESAVYKNDKERLSPIVAQLENRLPNLGFSRETPYMQFQKPVSQNVKSLGLGTE